MLGPYALDFTIDVGASPADVRQWTVRSVVGDGEAIGRPGTLTVLEQGPDRFASRYEEGTVSQLRVVEWSGERTAHGAVHHAVRGSPRLSARYLLEVAPAGAGSHLQVAYRLETPVLGLALSFRMARRRSLARRLSASWLRLEDERRWAALKLRTGPHR